MHHGAKSRVRKNSFQVQDATVDLMIQRRKVPIATTI
jgi:hypothetical protein